MDFEKQYLTYNEYKELGGTLAEMPFNLLEFKARKKIDELTFNRLVSLDSQVQEVKLCINELINSKLLDESSSTIASETVSKYSVTYSNSENKTSSIGNIICNYLSGCRLKDGTPYLYRGI